MKPEAQRVAIAEACGWNVTDKEITYPNGLKIGMHPPSYVMRVFLQDSPDYLNDLNAMHEAEKVLGNSGLVAQLQYIHLLSPCRFEWSLATATAAQRAAAFLKTLGKWEESA